MRFLLHPLALACLSAASLAAQANTLSLDSTVVTARGYASDSFDTPQAIEVLQPTAGSSAPAGSLLRGQPGLAVQSDGAWGQNPVLRGLKKESVVVMVDGIRVNSAQPQGALASFLDLGLLERMEVVKGPGSVLYGSGAMGGVVNLLTPQAEFSAQREQGGRFGVAASSVDKGFSGALTVHDSSSEHAVLLGLAGRDVGDYKSPQGREKNTGYQSDSLLLKYQQKIAEDYVARLNLQRHVDEDVWYPGSTRPVAMPPTVGIATIHSPRQERELYSLGLDAPLGEGTLSSEVYRQEVFRQIRAYSSRLQRNYVENDVSFITHGLRSAWTTPLGDNHRLTLGAETWKMTGDPQRFMSPLPSGVRILNNPFEDGELRSSGLFLQDEFSLGQSQFTAGLRYDRNRGDARVKGGTQTSGLDNTDHNLSWSLGVVQPLSATLNLYANLGQAYRTPDMRERFEDSARGDGYYHVGNPQLEAERSSSFELGLKGRDAGLSYQLAAFHTRIDDYIAGRVTGQVTPQGPVKRTENLDQVVIYGLEGGLQLPLGAFTVDAGFTWLRGNNQQDDEPLYQMPASELRLGIGQPAEQGLYWHAGLRAVAAQNRVATRFSNGTENNTDGFVTADASLGYGFGALGVLKTANLDLRLSNLANKQYHEHLTDGVSGQELAAPGRGATLAFSGSF